MQEGKRFKVVVADARPHLEGKVLRQRLIKHGIACTYILLNGLACVIRVRPHGPSLSHAEGPALPSERLCYLASSLLQ